jgi:4-hydroxybenzoate polyprenyltransferase
MYLRVREKTMIKKSKSTNILSSFKMLINSRVEMLFVFTWNAAVGSLIASRGFPSIRSTILGMTSALFLTLAVYIYNDIIDRDMDKESPYIRKREERVIAYGLVPVKHAYALVALSSILGLATAWAINRTTFLVGVFYWVFLMLYSFPSVRFKTMYIMKTFATAFGGPFFPLILGGSAIDNAVSPLVLFAGLVSGAYAFLVIPVVADYADMEEDRKFGIKTIPMVYSWSQVVKMLLAGPSLILVSGIIAYLAFGINVLSMVLIVASSLLIINKARKLPDEYDENMVRSMRKSIYAFFMLFDFLIFIGTLNLPTIIPFI